MVVLFLLFFSSSGETKKKYCLLKCISFSWRNRNIVFFFRKKRFPNRISQHERNWKGDAHYKWFQEVCNQWHWAHLKGCFIEPSGPTSNLAFGAKPIIFGSRLHTRKLAMSLRIKWLMYLSSMREKLTPSQIHDGWCLLAALYFFLARFHFRQQAVCMKHLLK